MNNTKRNPALEALKHHVTGAIERGEAKAIVSQPAGMTNTQAYEALTKANAPWTRKDATHIVVYTSGYVTQEAHDIEKFLMQAGMRLVSQEFDKVCGKTFNVFKHKAAV